jgi:hypothetical protein
MGGTGMEKGGISSSLSLSPSPPPSLRIRKRSMTRVASPSSTLRNAMRRSSKSPTEAGSMSWRSAYWSCSACRISWDRMSWLAGVSRRCSLTAYSRFFPGLSS